MVGSRIPAWILFSELNDTSVTSSAGAESAMLIDAKYLGPCPPDMKPGETIMPDGKKINTMGN